jgi:hypothetical protein
MAVFQIFKKEEGVGAGPDRDRADKRVTAAALAAVCNIVNEFSPLRPVSRFAFFFCSTVALFFFSRFLFCEKL